MADETDTPTTPTGDAKPAPRRRAAPRKTTGDTPKPRAARAKRSTGVVAATEEAASHAVEATKDAASGVVAAVRPRAGGRRKAHGDADAKPAAKRATTKKSASKAKASGGKGVRWGAIAGGVAATGAAVAALLTLRGSTSGKNLGTEKKPIDIGGTGDAGKAHPTTVMGSSGAPKPDGIDPSS